MLDVLTLMFATYLALQSASAEPAPTLDETRAVIIDTGAPAQAQNSPEVDETRAVIIDTGQH